MIINSHRHEAILSLIFVSFLVPVELRRRVINYEPPPPETNPPNKSPSRELLHSRTMEDILDAPEFLQKKSEIAQEPTIWVDALSAYEKMLKNRGRQVGPDGEPIGFYKPGVFSPWANPVINNTIIYTDQTSSEQKPLTGRNGQPTLSPPPSISSLNGRSNLFLRQGLGADQPQCEMTVYERFLENSIMSQTLMYGRCRGGPHPKGQLCFGIPHGCVDKGLCRLIVTFSYDDNSPKYVTVHLAGETSHNGYVAVAFSHDRFIGHDVVVYCIDVRNVPEPKVALFFSFTENYESFMQKDSFYYQSNVSPNFGYTRGRMMACSFNLSTNIYLDDGTGIDIMDDPFYLMLSFGHYIDKLPVNDTNYGAIKFQHLARFSESQVLLNYALNNPSTIYPRSRFLIFLHVIPSVVTTIFLLPSGMIMAKYGREAYGYTMKIGRYQVPKWLFIHVLTSVLSLPLIIISLITILIELDFTWRSVHLLPVLHSIFGFISMILVGVNLVGVCFFRTCMKQGDGENNEVTKKDIACTWVHWVIGNLTYLLGIYCVVVAGSMGRAHAPCFVEYFGYLHILIHVLTHLVLSYDTHKLVKLIDQKDLCQRTILGPMIPWQADIHNVSDLSEFPFLELWNWRRIGVMHYFIVSFLCAFAISILMLFPVVLCR